MTSDADDMALVQRLENAPDVPDIHAICKTMARGLGFRYFVYAVRVPVSLTQPYHFSITGYPKDWRDRYNDKGYLTVDPVVAHVLSSLKPLVWDQVDMSSPAVQAFFADAAEHGLAHGMTVPIYGRGGEVSLLSVARATPVPREQGRRMDMIRRLQFFATHVHEAVRNVILNPRGQPLVESNLSDREKQCLIWAADGYASWEIARLLQISERTVNFHLQNASEKLGVQGSRNAVAKAIALGEIETPAYSNSPGGRVPTVYWHTRRESGATLN